jgi:hypothetical protein
MAYNEYVINNIVVGKWNVTIYLESNQLQLLGTTSFWDMIWDNGIYIYTHHLGYSQALF